jgi:hypothetical protein
MKFLRGKKTYIVVIVGVIFNGAVSMGYLDPSYLELVNTVLGFLGLGTLRDGIKK